MQLNDLPNVAMVFVVAAMIFGAGALALNAFQDTLPSTSVAHNVTRFTLNGLQNTTNQFGTIGTIIGIVILMGIVVGGFYVFGRKR